MLSTPDIRPKLSYLKIETEGDYTRLEEKDEVKIGICEVNGNNPRRRQEDDCCTDASRTSESFMDLKPEERKQVAKATFATLQSHMQGKDKEKVGSCACVATGQVKDDKVAISTSYVGDSIAVLVILHADGSFTSIPCNPELHDADNDMEYVAVSRGYSDRTKGTFGGGQRLLKHRPDGGVDGVAVTRALGDMQFDGAGISHIPQTTEIKYELKEGDVPFMFVGCDGTMEHCKGFHSVARFAQELGEVVSAAYKLDPSPEAIAEKIVDNALAKKSQDNITAMITPLTKKAVTVGVFDGHGGAGVAQTLGLEYNKVFSDMVDHPEKVASAEAEEKERLATKIAKDIQSRNFEGLQTTPADLQRDADQSFYQRPIDAIRKCLENLGNDYEDYKKEVNWVLEKFKEKYSYVNKEGFSLSSDNLLPLKNEFLEVYRQLEQRKLLLNQNSSFEAAGLKEPEAPSAYEKLDNNEISLGGDESEISSSRFSSSKDTINQAAINQATEKTPGSDASPPDLKKARMLLETLLKEQPLQPADLTTLVAPPNAPVSPEKPPTIHKRRKWPWAAFGGGAGGAVVGAVVGGFIGSIIPGVGTALGAVIGGVVGGLVGAGVTGGIGYYTEGKGSSDIKEKQGEAGAGSPSDDKREQKQKFCNRSTRSCLEAKVASCDPGSYSPPEVPKMAGSNVETGPAQAASSENTPSPVGHASTKFHSGH